MENEATLLFDDEEEFVYRPSLRDVLKRKLTAAEIEYVLSPITSMQSIPPATALSIMRSIKDPLRHELAALLAYPQIIPKLRHAIESNIQRLAVVKILASQQLRVLDNFTRKVH